MRTLVESLTEEGDTVFDPFTGGGTVPAACKTLKRNYIAFEIDEEMAVSAQERVDNTQPPLPLRYYTQDSLV
jgi:DNA modification methylase